jgi:hypothetical protein
MQRRGESGQPGKGRRTLRPKARKASTAGSTTDLQEQVAAFTRELREAREQLTEALEYQSQVLNVISRSRTDARPVFDMIAESAAPDAAVAFVKFMAAPENRSVWKEAGFEPAAN